MTAAQISAHTEADPAAQDPYRLIQEVFAHYVRAADYRDPQRMSALFAPEATVRIYYRGAGELELLAELTGAATIGAAVAAGMAPHPPLGWSHHTLLNPIVTLEGDQGAFDAQFIVYNAHGLARPAEGWPPSAFGAQGTIVPIECGYARVQLQRDRTRWLITELVIEHDLPYAFPAP